jgi:sensor histidine kinase regulating citrate/malate metabolism
MNLLLSGMSQFRYSTRQATLRRVRETIVAVEKQQVLRIISVCVCVALVIHHAKRMRRVILPYVSLLAVPYFSTLSHKRRDFRKTVAEYETRVLICSKNSISNTFVLKIIQSDIVINIKTLHAKEPVILVTF